MEYGSVMEKRSASGPIGDAELIRRYVGGDEAAFEELYFRYRRLLYGFLNNLIRGDAAAVDEVFEETWLRVIAELPRYRDDGKFGAWLFRIARNKYFDRYRRQSRRKEAELSEPVMAVAIDETLPEPDLALNNQQLQELIGRAMDELSPEQREVFLLRQNDVGFKEIAEIQHCSLNTALSRMQYAVKNLRRILTEAGV